MTKNATLHIRVNESVKDSAEATLSTLGMSISEAVNMFLCQVSLVGGIPFEVKLPGTERMITESDGQLAEKPDAGSQDMKQGGIRAVNEVYAEWEAKQGL